MLKDPDLSAVNRAFKSMLVIADKEAVYHLGEMLKDESEYRIKYIRTNPDGSISYGSIQYSPPSYMAEYYLSRLVKYPPVNVVDIDLCTREDIEKWRSWWKKARPQFSDFFEKDK